MGNNTTVEYNTIYNNGETGLVVGVDWENNTGTTTIRYNTIYGHVRNFEIRSLDNFRSPGNLTLNFSYNNLLGTPTWHVTNASSNVALANNYWGTTDASAIALKISDNDDDFRLVQNQAAFSVTARCDSCSQPKCAQTRSASSCAVSRRAGSTTFRLPCIQCGSMRLSHGLLVGR